MASDSIVSNAGYRCESDAIYYRDGLTNPLSEWAMSLARRQMYNLLCQEFPVSSTNSILDIGVSSVQTAESNGLERFYPHKHMLTCAGLDDGSEFKRHHPGIDYVRIARGGRLPFPDKKFNIAYSNAVLEHVGGPEERAFFVSEALRVAKGVFFTVPNKWFPIEHHTGVWLLHYSSALFRRKLRNTEKSYWTHQENVDFLTKSLLRIECKKHGHLRLKYCGLRIGPFSSNIALIIK